MVKIFNIHVKNIGPLLLLPLVLFIPLFLSLISKEDVTKGISLLLVQILLVLVTAVLMTFVFYDRFEGKSSVTDLIDLYRGNMVRVATPFILLLSLLAVVVVILVNLIFQEAQVLPISLLLISQIILISHFTMFLFVIFKEAQFVLSIISLYLLIEFFSWGSFQYFIHPFFLNYRMDISFSNSISITVLNLIISVILMEVLSYMIPQKRVPEN